MPTDDSIVSERIRRRRDIDDMDLLHPVRELVLQCLEDKPSKRPRAFSIVNYLQKWKDGKHRLTLKIILVGNSGAGKTTLLRRFVNPTYPFDTIRATIGVGTFFVPVRYRDGLVTLQLLDTAGQERYNSIPPFYLRGAHGAFVVYDVTDPRTFRDVDMWIQRVRDECDENVRVILIGNKADQERRVARESAEDCAENNNVEYFETSAKTLENVELMFEHMKEKLLEGLAESDFATVSSVVSFSQEPIPQSKCCE